jgi:hypothetical protein
MKVRSVRPVDALDRILGSVDALRNGGALYLLLAGFSGGGLFLAMARSSAAGDPTGQAPWWQLVLALAVAFYGANAAGLVLMDQARGRPCRSIGEALRDALRPALRLLALLALLAFAAALLFGAAAALLAGGRLPAVGPAVFGLAVPLAVLLLGGGLLVLALVIGPLAAPAAWSGEPLGGMLRFLLGLLRTRLVEAVLLVLAVAGLTALVGALVTFVVASGARAVLLLSELVGPDLPMDQWIAGLYGYGLRTLGAARQPIVQDPRAAAALVGGGLVFALALALPGLVYLRGHCAVFLALAGDEPTPDAP